MSLLSGWGHAEVLVGVSDSGAADTALSTLCPNPLKTDRCLALAFGEGAYVEDDGSRRPFQSGVTSTTIDVRSTVAAKPWIVILIPLEGTELFETDHSSVTT